MTQTFEDQILALVADVADIKTALGAVTAPTVDFTPVTTAIAALGTDLDARLDAITAQFQPTPAPVPTPVDNAPATV